MEPPTRTQDSMEARLLESACRAFAENGFRDTTVADICRGADANVAAVNYYFRSKENLYVEAWRRSFHRSLRAHPPHGGVSDAAPAAERLAGRIRSVIARIMDPQSHEFDIIRHEHATPTGLLAEITREAIEPLRRDMAAIVRELLGPQASERDVRLCVLSIIGQCFGILMRMRAARQTERPPGPALPLNIEAEELAEHITAFSLAGIEQKRRHGREGERPRA